MLAKGKTYRAFVARPTHVLDLSGELLDGAPVLSSLASEVRDISAYATYVVRNDEALGDELARATATVEVIASYRDGSRCGGPQSWCDYARFSGIG